MLRRSIFNPLLAKVVSGTSYTTIMQNYLTRLAAEGGTLTDAEKGYLNTLTLNADIGEFDRLWIHGLSNQISARISLVNALTADLLTEVNSPTWTAYEGYQGNGTTMYLNTNYNPSTNGVKYTLNSASFGAYSLTNNTSGDIIIGLTQSSPLNYSHIINRSGDVFYAYINTTSTGGIPIANLDSSGLFCVNTNSTSQKSFKNGSQVSIDTVVLSSSLANLNFYVLGRNVDGSLNSPSNKKISASFIGSGAINQSQFYTDIQTLGTQLGWAV